MQTVRVNCVLSENFVAKLLSQSSDYLISLSCSSGGWFEDEIHCDFRECCLQQMMKNGNTLAMVIGGHGILVVEAD